MRKLIGISLVIVTTCMLMACTNNNKRSVKYNSLVDQTWETRKQVIIDSMQYNCNQKMAQKISEDVNKVLKQKGLR